MPKTPTAQELGLEGAVLTAPAPADVLLPSGRMVQWRQPDLFTALSFLGTLPSPVISAVIKLLKNEGSYIAEDDPLYAHTQAQQILGMYGIAQFGIVGPKTLDASKEWGDGATLGRRDLAYADVEYLYYRLFRLGH